MLKKNLVSVVLTVALLVAVPAGALFLWGSSAGVAQAEPIGQEVFAQNEATTALLLAAHALPPAQRIQTKAMQRASDQGTVNPSTPVFARFE